MRSDRRGFHFDNSIGWGHLLTTITFIVGMFVWANTMDKRVSSNTLNIQFLSQTQKSTNDRVDTLRAEIRQDLRDINDKLDRLIRSQAGQ